MMHSVAVTSPDALLSLGWLAPPLALMVGALGVPVPGTLLLLAAGALVRSGTLDPLAVLSPALLGVVAGDSAGYPMGRCGGSLVLGRVARGGRPDASWQRARDALDRWGGPAVFLTRFLLTPLAAPLNLVAGGSGYRFGRFLAFDVAGEAVWVCLFTGLGYLFAGSPEALSAVSSNLSWCLLAAAVLALGVYGTCRRLPGRRAV